MSFIHEESLKIYDVLIIGGGAAGLAASVTLSRALRSVLVLDAGTPRNAPAEGIHAFLSREGMNPLEFLEVGRSEAVSYGAEVEFAEVLSLKKVGDVFEATLSDGSLRRGRKLLIATGLKDVLPAIPGLREQWGKGVVHCPYCHGYEIRGKKIGILATGPLSGHQALLFRQWSDDITFFLNDLVVPSEEELLKFKARSIKVVEGPVTTVDEEDGVLSGVTLESGQKVHLEALAVGTRMEVRAEMVEGIGLEVVPHPSGMGNFIEAGPMGVTSVPGVYVAGNVSNLMAQVVVAAAEGTMAGAFINAVLIEEKTLEAVKTFSA